MSDFRPIETRYRGYRFRSRLEARWAVFFDQMALHYRYESEGFEINGKRYLPDFFLPELDVWAEVKPLTAELQALWEGRNRGEVLTALTDGPMDFSLHIQLAEASTRTVLVLFGLPDEGFIVLLSPALAQQDAILHEAFVECQSCRRLGLSVVGARPEWAFSPLESPRRCRIGCAKAGFTRSNTSSAAEEARSARFEHGEIGGPSDWKR